MYADGFIQPLLYGMCDSLQPVSYTHLTSSIDVKTEKQLQEGLQNMLKGRTSFIVAHRLSTIRNCDRILYISDKGILESGSHDELMAKKGLYYKLYLSQTDEEAKEAG